MTAPRERPILFSGETVRAILDGRKTQTRRALRPQPPFLLLTDCETAEKAWHWCIDLADANKRSAWDDHAEPYLRYCPYGQPGDRLWVRETWALHGNDDSYPVTVDGSMCAERDAERWYRADTCPGPYGSSLLPGGAEFYGPWRPSIFMPRWASRLTLEIVSVTVERLQEISEENAKAEGVRPLHEAYPSFSPDQRLTSGERAGLHPHRSSFAILWDDLNPKQRWYDNPWVWRIEFKVV
jgi:hypothetical protein